MQLTESFTVPVTADRLWTLLTDVERIAPCVPGFSLREANDPDYMGQMTVKVGAITVQYDATITFVERDDAARRAVLSVTGRERRGSGSVNARVTSLLIDKGAETTAEIVTDVEVTGRVAQFGRGIIADVSTRMTEQFVERLGDLLAAPAGSATDDATGGAAQAAGVRSGEPEALDLGAVAAVPILKRVGMLMVLLALAFEGVRRLRRRSR